MTARKMIEKILYYAVLLLALWLGLRWFEWRSVYFPFRTLSGTPDEVGLAFENVVFTASDGVKLHGWYLPADGARLTLLLSHGNGGNISHRIGKLLLLHQLGVNVFIYDYRGYGRSEGRPGEEGTYRDALAAYDWLRANKNVRGDQIVAYGESLGSAITVELAVHRPVAAVVLESPFASVPDMARAVYPWLPLHLLCRIRYDSLSKIGKLKAPLLVFHSPTDEIVPFAQGEKLFAAAPEPKRFVRLRGYHNDGFEVSEQVYHQALAEFLHGLSPGS
ncbi:MAG: alpha/beta hydrolase [Verrucomicrobia bacterium]|nr:alpha/beta hydrolase [Verrucomicrobiota bacterium]